MTDRLERAFSARASELPEAVADLVLLAAVNDSDKEIGRHLYLSHRTVASHLYRMFPKLGVTSRAQLARAAFERVPVAAVADG